METHEYRIVSEPRGPAYEALVHYCATVGQTCSLVDLLPKSKAGRTARDAFLQRAEPHLIRTQEVSRWPLGSMDGGGLIGKNVPLWLFALKPPMVQLLLDSPRGLYGWTGPKLPEDLAIYRQDASILLGTIAHEHMGWMELLPDEAADRRLGLVELEPAR